MSAAQNKSKPNSDGFDIGKSRSGSSKYTDSAKRTARIALVTTIVVAVLYVASLFINSNYFRQNFTAVTIDNVKYSVTDFNYYYQNIYMQYYQAVSGTGDLGAAMLPDQNSPLKSQIYDPETGETWSEFFQKMAFEQMKADNKIYVEAQNAGYQLSDEEMTKLNADMDGMITSAYMNGYTKVADYLKAAYGKAMDEETYRKNAERTYLINSYTDHVHDSFNYSQDEIEAYYIENQNVFDTFTYRYFLVSGEKVVESDYADTAAYDAAKEAAVEVAGVKAKEYAAKITDDQSFIAAAREYDPETYKDDSASQRIYKGELLGSTYGEWLRDPSRQNGDVTAIKSTTGYYVVFFESRDDNHYQTVNIQQVLVKPETIDKTQYTEDDGDAAYNAAVDTAKKTAEEMANKIYQEWLDGGATQDKLTELMTTYSADISVDDSKLNENVYKSQLPAEVNAWIYDSARKPDDHAVIYSDPMGYYIINFVGPGEQYSDTLSDAKKRDKDLQAWKDSLTGGELKTTWLMALSK